jgi:hypothetical protein
MDLATILLQVVTLRRYLMDKGWVVLSGESETRGYAPNYKLDVYYNSRLEMQLILPTNRYIISNPIRSEDMLEAVSNALSVIYSGKPKSRYNDWPSGRDKTGRDHGL